jgi:hypothetical protein
VGEIRAIKSHGIEESVNRIIQIKNPRLVLKRTAG